MKRIESFKIYAISLFVLFGLSASAQAKYERIAVFTKVWGFLKYHHPAVAAGRANWDSVYISNISKIEISTSDTKFNEQLLLIINGLSPLTKQKKAKVPDTLFTGNHDLGWIDANKIIQKKLKNRLKEIYTYRNQGENRYIKLKYSTADYSGESQYERMGFPDQNYRLLFLARFWNAINYFAPYKYEIGEDWSKTLIRFIPKMIAAKDTLSYYKTLLLLSVSLNDGHSQFTVANDNAPINNLVFGKFTAPVYAAVENGQIIITKVAADSLNHYELNGGDLILSIDGEPASKRLARIGAYVSASNAAARNNFLTWVLFNTHNEVERLEVKRGHQIFSVKVKCILAKSRPWTELTNYTFNNTGYKAVGNSVAYVYAAQLWHGNIDTIKALIKSKKAVIFDVRNYPGGDDFFNIFDIFLPEPKVINQTLYLSLENPGCFLWHPSPRIGNINKAPYRGQVIILTDERSQSQGEYAVMCLQTIPNAVTIGSRTAGADGVVTAIPMGSKRTISYSGYGIFYPDKKPTQRCGVRIDIEAKKTVESISRGEDVALEKALQYLKEKGID